MARAVKASMETIWQIDGGRTSLLFTAVGLYWEFSYSGRHVLLNSEREREREKEREKERLWQEFIIILCQWRNLANIVRRSWNFPPSVSGDAIQKLIFKIFVLLQILEKRKFLLTMNAVDEVIYYIFIARKPTENPFFTIGFRWHSTDQAALKD